MRVFRELITSLGPDQVFVFGSNTAGAHGGGAAGVARQKFGARNGQPRGMQGQSYAIPTCTADIRLLPLGEIQDDVDTFLTVVRDNPEKIFLLTPIGTGIAGGDVRDMAELFREGMYLGNLVFPVEFADVLQPK
jgi:hypothetical protein